MGKWRGSVAAPSAVVSGDRLGAVAWLAGTGATTGNGVARIEGESGGGSSGQINFLTNSGAGVLERWVIDPGGALTGSNAVGLGIIRGGPLGTTQTLLLQGSSNGGAPGAVAMIPNAVSPVTCRFTQPVTTFNESFADIDVEFNGDTARLLHLDASIDGIGFYTATAIAQPGAITKPSGGATVDAEARTAIDSLIDLVSQAASGLGLTA